ncbi:MAG: haloacid dehalogenase type II [Thermomicrobiales bacterium]|nr:haloacid dehalogenase type II [Thermomicrobiales bacterium]
MQMPKVITFDCYDTLCEFLIDDVTRELLVGRADGVDMAAMLRDYEALRLHTTSHLPYAPYRDVLRDTQREIFTRYGVAWRESDAEALLAEVVTWGPFPDVPPALETLRQHCKLAIISNSDDDIMAQNVANIGVPIDDVITAQQAGAYKPAKQAFDYALHVLGVSKEDVLHVAQGFEYDMVPAHAMGWDHVWINRYGLPGDQTYGPYYEQTDLSGVVKLLGLA